MIVDNLNFRRMVRANRLIAEGKCPGCEMDYKPKMNKLKTELRDLKALHREIIEQGRKVLNATSDEGLSHSDFIEWALDKLEGK